MLTDEQREIVLSNLNLVDYLLQKNIHIYPNDQNYEDYQQEGRIGLILAAMRYDESRGFEFSTLASTYILGYMKSYRREFLHRYIHIPRSLIDMIPSISELHNEGYIKEEIIKKLNIKESDYSLLLSSQNITSIYSHIDSDEDICILDTIGMCDMNIVDVLGEERILDAINKTADIYKKESHRSIWFDYIYPAYYGEKVTTQALADKYKVSQACVSRILNEGKFHLNKILEN